METTSITGVEIFGDGQHGADFYSRDDLDAMIAAHEKLGFQPTVMLDDDNKNRPFGAPALGYVRRIYRRGGKVLADLVNVPKKFAEIIKSQKYRKLGTQIYWAYRDESTNRVWPRVLKAVTFSGTGLALDTLDAIAALFGDRTVARAYDGHREFKSYLHEVKEHNPMENVLIEKASLSTVSTALHEEIREYAQKNNLDYLTATRKVLREYQQTDAAPPANELASMARSIQSALGMSFIDSILRAAETRPDLVRKLADEWLLEKAREAASGKPGGGFQSENQSAALMDVVRKNPLVATVRNTGRLDETGLRILFPQWFRN